MPLWVAFMVVAWGTDGTTDTGADTTSTDVASTDRTTTDEGETTDVGTIDTDYCEECQSAAELAGEEGLSPCGSGCSSSGGAPLALLLPLALLVARRRA